MAISMVQVRGHYEDAHRNLQTGSVTLTPSVPISNGTTQIATVPVTAGIVNGDASITVAANDDTGTTPGGMTYQVTESLDVPNGPPLVSKYLITVSAANAATGIDLATAPRALVTLPQYAAYLTQITADARYQLIGPYLTQATADLRYALLTTLAQRAATGLLNVQDYGAVGNGTTDDKAAIQAAINAAPLGGIVQLESRQYALSGKLTIPPYVSLRGRLADRDGAGDGAACLLPKPGFTDPTVIELVDKATGGYATENRDVTLDNFTIDGRLLTTESVIGIRATGMVHGVQLHNVSIHKVTGHGISLVNGASGNPYSWYMDNVQISGSGSVTTWDGFHLIGTDHVLTGCRTEGVRGNGFFLSGCANSMVLGCRAEWSAANGFYITGSYGTAVGSGSIQLDGCATDRNSQYGVLIDSTGSGQVLVTGLMARRDGRNGFPGTGGGGLAALRGTGSTTPIIVTGMSCYPGVGDDGLGVNSPERGASFVSCTWVSVSDSYLHADLTPFHDGGGNTLYRGPNVGTATGPTNTPTRSATEQVTVAGPVTATQGGFTVTRGTNTNTAFQAQVSGDTTPRYNVDAAGTATYGSGAAARDTTFGRGAANRLDATTADLRIATVGRGLQVATGANAKFGTLVLNGATPVVTANTSVTAGSQIFLTVSAVGGTPAHFWTSAKTAGTSFAVTGTAGDTSTLAYLIVEP